MDIGIHENVFSPLNYSFYLHYVIPVYYIPSPRLRLKIRMFTLRLPQTFKLISIQINEIL